MSTNLMKLDVHHQHIVICIYFKIHEIQFRGYLVIANYMDFKLIHELMNFQGPARPNMICISAPYSDIYLF